MPLRLRSPPLTVSLSVTIESDSDARLAGIGLAPIGTAPGSVIVAMNRLASARALNGT